MPLIIKIDTDNAAFTAEDEEADEAMNADARAGECARILRSVADVLGYGYTSGVLYDVNGNNVGTWSVGA